MFLDPNQPIKSCTAADCQDCPVRYGLHCHFHGRDLTQFFLMMLPVFLIGGAGVVHAGWGYVIPWILIAIAYFGFIEIRVMCSHCPHYNEDTGSGLRCWANYGSPKLWKYRPGPMSTGENIVFYGGLLAVMSYPLIFLIGGGQWLLLAFYLAALAAGGATMQVYMCAHCYNFACPLNRVEDSLKAAFFARNPEIAAAWNWEPPAK